MPKNSNIIPNKHKYFVYQTQSPKKTHCPKTINNYNCQAQPEFLLNQPSNHWTKERDHINWKYFELLANQLILSLSEFGKTQDWHNWTQTQRNYHLLKNLIHNSINMLWLNS